MTAKANDTTTSRVVFYRKLMQALKTKTGAVQTKAVKRIYYLAVRSLDDSQLADLSLQMDFTPRGMQPAYYVNYAEAMIEQLLRTRTPQGKQEPRTMQTVLARMNLA